MMQVKKTASKAKKAVDLRTEFLALAPKEQQVVTNFFNLHNAAHLLYDLLSEKGQAYVSYCIQLSQEATKIEKKNV